MARTYHHGAAVEVVSVDMNGLQGRYPHPPQAAEGRIGYVVGAPMYEYDADDTEPVLTFYTINIPRMGQFLFADYEVN